MVNTSSHHKARGCTKTKARRLYVRDYTINTFTGKRKQVFIPWGITCLSCNLVIYSEKVSGLGNIGKPHWLRRQEKRRYYRNKERRDKILDKLKKYNPSDPEYKKLLLELHRENTISDPEYNRILDELVHSKKE